MNRIGGRSGGSEEGAGRNNTKGFEAINRERKKEIKDHFLRKVSHGPDPEKLNTVTER